jgi:wyosine [tRNA(Phe)-imidazoG37] synthetase (radical SAM superfamily)
LRLSTKIHDRDNAGLTYVYPVVSRRARGVSVGINLNPNNACNFRCVYCQVPGLTFGKAPPIDLERLEDELRTFLTEVFQGDYMERHVPEGSRVLRDIAFSGNGEPTSSSEFLEAVRITGRVLAEFGQLGRIKLVLITNGSLIHQEQVGEALRALKPMQGEVWFKLDSATEVGMKRLNNFTGGLERVRANLAIAARACPTWLQTCVLDWNDGGPSRAERDAYLDFLRWTQREELPIEGVLLYGLARQSHQPEAPELAALPLEWLERFASEIEALGVTVRVSA